MIEKMDKQERNGIGGQTSDQFRHAEVRRFLNKMPLFRPDESPSRRLEDLLARLEETELRGHGH